MKAAFVATTPDLVVLCLPGALSNLPIEAFAEAARQDDATVPWPKNFVYAPSLAIVAKSGISPPLDATSRILVVGYHDLASAEAEVADVVAAFPIDTLNGDYAAVHLVCHGTYEANAPSIRLCCCAAMTFATPIVSPPPSFANSCASSAPRLRNTPWFRFITRYWLRR